MEKVSLFGKGFIGTAYVEKYPEETIVIPRNQTWSKTPDILYMISTIHNYHPKDGDPFIDIETNLVDFMDVLSKAYKDWGDKLVFNYISTWFVYGQTELPAKETSPTNPKGFYSITKRCAEQLLVSYCETFNLKWRILRLGNVIGIGDKKISRRRNALQHMVRELAQGRSIDYLYKGGAIRDYIDVRDCVEAIHLVLEKGNLNEVYNIANGQGLNVNDLVRVAWAESGYKPRVDEIEVPNFHKTVQTPKMYLDTRKLRSLGYIQRHDIKQTIKELVHYYKNEANQNS